MGQSDEPADTFLFLGLLGQFVNIFGGIFEINIFGVYLKFFGNKYILIIICEKSWGEGHLVPSVGVEKMLPCVNPT